MQSEPLTGGPACVKYRGHRNCAQPNPPVSHTCPAVSLGKDTEGRKIYDILRHDGAEQNLEAQNFNGEFLSAQRSALHGLYIGKRASVGVFYCAV